METFVAQFLTIAIVHFLAVASPGPDFAVVVKTAFLSAEKRRFIRALGWGSAF